MQNRYPQLTNMLALIKAMHTKFGINYEGAPRILSAEEKQFRFEGMNEEVIEFKDAQSLEEQLDALIDNAVFTFGTTERMGLLDRFEEGFHRVMECNMNKELGPNNKRGGFSIDLRKPDGWVGPDHTDLVQDKIVGLVVLDGPDASGKTTLANTLAEKYDGEVIHFTWNEELEKNMDTYMMGTLLHAITLSKEKLVIIDRLWMSELVYSEVFRGGTKYDALHWDIRNLLNDINATQVICLPGLDDWQENYWSMCGEREEMYGEDSRMLKVFEAYFALFTGDCLDTVYTGRFFPHTLVPYKLNAIRYNYTLGPAQLGMVESSIFGMQPKKSEK